MAAFHLWRCSCYPAHSSTLECGSTDSISQDPGYKLIIDPLLGALAEEASHLQRQWLETVRDDGEPDSDAKEVVGGQYRDILDLLLAELKSRLDLAENPDRWPFRSRMLLLSTTPVYLLRGQDDGVNILLFGDGAKRALDEHRETHSVPLCETTLLLADQENGATHGRMLFFMLTGEFLECIWSVEEGSDSQIGVPQERYRILSPDRAYRRLRLIGKREVVAEHFPQIYSGLDPSATAAVLVSPEPAVQDAQSDTISPPPTRQDRSADTTVEASPGTPPSSGIKPRSFARQLSATYGPEVAREVGRYIKTDIDMGRLLRRLGVPPTPDLAGQQIQICQFLDEYGTALFLTLIRHEYDQREIDRQKLSRNLGFRDDTQPGSNYNYPFGS